MAGISLRTFSANLSAESLHVLLLLLLGTEDSQESTNNT